jgi:hypothetical protein
LPDVFGQIESSLSLAALARLLDAGEWHATLGRYVIRLRSPLGQCALQADGADYLLEGGIEGANVNGAARSLSEHLTARGIRHRLEIYDSRGELVLYLHHDWPRA